MTNLAALQPMNDGIVVKVLALPDMGRIIVPEVAEQRTHIGRVVAIGPGRRSKQGKRIPIAVRVDDVVWFSLNDLEQGEYSLIREGDVGGIIDAC